MTSYRRAVHQRNPPRWSPFVYQASLARARTRRSPKPSTKTKYLRGDQWADVGIDKLGYIYIRTCMLELVCQQKRVEDGSVLSGTGDQDWRVCSRAQVCPYRGSPCCAVRRTTAPTQSGSGCAHLPVKGPGYRRDFCWEKTRLRPPQKYNQSLHLIDGEADYLIITWGRCTAGASIANTIGARHFMFLS